MKAVDSKLDIFTFSPALRLEDTRLTYWMRQVTARLRREICWRWHERGLLPDTSQATLPPFVDKASASLGMSRYWEEKNLFFETDPTAHYLTEQIRAVMPDEEETAVRGSFGWVTDSLNLDDAASFILALGLMVAFDNAAGDVIAVCLNDPGKILPNLALAQKLWDEPEQVIMLSDTSHPLFSYGLLQNEDRTSLSVDWESPIAVSSLVAKQLLFPDSSLPSDLVPIAAYAGISEDDGSCEVTDGARLIASRLASGSGDILQVLPVRGPKGSACIETVHALAKLSHRNVVEFKGDPGLLEDRHYLNSLATLCWLKGVELFIGQSLISAMSNRKQRPDAPLLPLQSIPINIFLGITERGQVSNIPDHLLLPIVDVPRFSYSERVAHWNHSLGAKADGLDSAISECSRRFRYEKETVSAISKGLRQLPGQILEKDLIEACRAELDLDIGELAQKVTPRFEDEELILPQKQRLQFEEIISAMGSLTEVHYNWGTAKAWNEGGVSVLFSGPPGTGKTMAAEILAIKLDLPMYRIDLSQVVNKYIGETEKNLKRLFDTADISDMILFFDEADSLFGKRTEVKDAHDRYANLEISYLLERMERFKGLSILATNRRKDLDEAFLRRLRYIVEFSFPELEERKRIWRQVIPDGLDTSEVDIDFLAKQFPLAGGHIRSIVFNACLQSANGTNGRREEFKGKLEMEQIIVAVKREYDKLNRPVSLEHFGSYAKIVKEIEGQNGRRKN